MWVFVCLLVYVSHCIKSGFEKHASLFILLFYFFNFFFFCFQCIVSWFGCHPLRRKHLACDARFIVGTIIKSITDEPDARVRDERKKYRKKRGGDKKEKKKENSQQSEISQLDDIRKNQHHRRAARLVLCSVATRCLRSNSKMEKIRLAGRVELLTL